MPSSQKCVATAINSNNNLKGRKRIKMEKLSSKLFAGIKIFRAIMLLREDLNLSRFPEQYGLIVELSSLELVTF